MASRKKSTQPRRSRKRPELDRGRRKGCRFCKNHVEDIDYKDVDTLSAFISDKAKMRGRRVSGTCRKHQAQLAKAIKRSRELALLPYIGTSR